MSEPSGSGDQARDQGATEPGENQDSRQSPENEQRRWVVRGLSRLAMFGGLIAGYGLFGAMAARFLFPSGRQEDRWTFVADLSRLKPGESFVFRTPAGAPVNIARLGDSGSAEDFVALSSVCPHLGCQVFWQPQEDRFFCPCHNGAFDRQGNPTEGPPAEANQPLTRFPLKLEKGLLYMELPYELRTASHRSEGAPSGPGHDPCLYRRPADGKTDGAVRKA